MLKILFYIGLLFPPDFCSTSNLNPSFYLTLPPPPHPTEKFESPGGAEGKGHQISPLLQPLGVTQGEIIIL